MNHLEKTATPLNIIIAIVMYSLCSSTLLLANKMIIEYISPSVSSFLQVVFTTLVCLAIKLVGLFPVDDFEYDKLKSYFVYIIIFVGVLYTNMKALEASNVETVIVFRSCTPIAVSLMEYFFMNRELPSVRSSISLFLIGFGAVLYCLSDSQFSLHGFSSYTWSSIYFILITLEMTVGKELTSSVKMDSVWGPVLYCNFLSIIPIFLLGYGHGDYHDVFNKLNNLPVIAHLILIFSCLVGTCIGYTVWVCRGMVSATTFTLVGVINKFLTVLLNVLIWDKHSTPLGIFAVCVCLGSGFFYQQAPRRSDKKLKANEVLMATVSESKESIAESAPLLQADLGDKK